MLEPIEVPSFDHDPRSADAWPKVSELLDETARRIDVFTKAQYPPIDNFVVCDGQLVHAAIAWMIEESLLTGNRFCEWGSGFGLATLLASLHGLDACGIEVEQVLVDHARQLAEDFSIDAEFVQGSFIPEGSDELLQYSEDADHIDTDWPSGYDELGKDIDEFDLFFAFPWPGEHRYWESIFDHHAADGALLLTYHGIERLRLHRRV